MWWVIGIGALVGLAGFAGAIWWALRALDDEPDGAAIVHAHEEERFRLVTEWRERGE